MTPLSGDGATMQEEPPSPRQAGQSKAQAQSEGKGQDHAVQSLPQDAVQEPQHNKVTPLTGERAQSQSSGQRQVSNSQSQAATSHVPQPSEARGRNKMRMPAAVKTAVARIHADPTGRPDPTMQRVEHKPKPIPPVFHPGAQEDQDRRATTNQESQERDRKSVV